MPGRLSSIVPAAETLFALEPEELAGVLLECLHCLPETDKARLHRGNLLQANLVSDYPAQHHEAMLRALTEAWMWLEREGLLAPKPGPMQQRDFVFITRRGERLRTATDVSAYRRASLLPKELLHPVIAQKVWAAFIRGEYDTAVFQAFREVEVAVRNVGGFGASDIGTALMRSAFNATSGPLTDSTLPDGEREALAHLFAGAIGWCKNPQSHRNVAITRPEEAVELISLASYLLRTVDSRSPSTSVPS